MILQAIENSKKNHELEILNTFKKGNENLEIYKQKTSEKSSKDIITDLTKKNEELMKKNKILEELNISLQQEVIQLIKGTYIYKFDSTLFPILVQTWSIVFPNSHLDFKKHCLYFELVNLISKNML